MVVAINGTAAPGAGVQRTLDIVWDLLLPTVGEPLGDDPAAYGALRQRLSRLALPKPRYNSATSLLKGSAAWAFRLESNTASIDPGMYTLFTERDIRGIETLGLAFVDRTCQLSWRMAGKDYQLLLGLDGMPRLNDYVTATGIPDTALASGAWLANDVFEADIRFIETCFHKIITFTFEHDRVHVRVADTYSGADQAPAPVVDIVGHRA